MIEDEHSQSGAPARLAQDLGAALLDQDGDAGLLLCDGAGGIVFCNKPGAVLLGVPAQSAGLSLAELVRRAGDETLALHVESALRGEAVAEFVAPRPAAEDEWLEVRSLPLRQGMAFFLNDVTARERSERQLRRKEQRLLATNESLRMAHQAVRGASWEWRAGRGLRWTDLAAARDLAAIPEPWTEEDLVADWRELTREEHLDATLRALDTLRETGAVTVEFELTGTDGRPHWMQCSAMVVERERDGRLARVSGITMDVTERKQTEQRLRREVADRRRAEAHQQLLINELNHRVKNTLATVQSVARQTLGRALGPAAISDFEDRLMALAWAHDILTNEHWAGASLLNLIERTMAAHVGRDTPRATVEGPDLKISPKMALALAMGLHELATNAAKYGALSNETGRVVVRWRVDTTRRPERLVLDWREEGGPPVAPPAHRGFGSRLIERGLASELGGEATLTFAPEGVRCRINAPLREGDGDALAALLSTLSPALPD